MSFITKSPWVIHYDGSSCNGCDIEVLASLTPMYDLERFGIVNAGNPKHADVFLVTGSVNEQNIHVIKEIYEQMPRPKVVIAIGICAISGGVFRDCYNIKGGVDKVIPVDVYVPGCAARPESIIDGVVLGLGILEEKRKRMAEELLAEKRSAANASAAADLAGLPNALGNASVWPDQPDQRGSMDKAGGAQVQADSADRDGDAPTWTGSADRTGGAPDQAGSTDEEIKGGK